MSNSMQELFDKLTRSQQQELLNMDPKELLNEINNKLKFNKMAEYKPYQKQKDFHNLDIKERLFLGGNQMGKTYCGAMEMAYHLTGLYPEWWTGRKFTKPIRAIAGSESAELTKKGIQRNLLGDPEKVDEYGSAALPKDCIKLWKNKAGVQNTVDNIVVKHVSGGESSITFLSYEQGRGKWQADTVDLVWFDEEPPEDIYNEGITRTNAKNGIVFITFTPLKGLSTVVRKFYPEPNTSDRGYIQMGINDVEHYSEKQKKKILDALPPHEREARANGTPMMGDGLIFNIPEDKFVIDNINIRKEWAALGGIDFGWDHPTGSVKIYWDKDEDVIYVTNCFKARQTTPLEFTARVKSWGQNLLFAWPHDGLQTDKGSGKTLASQYKEHGLKMCDDRATFEDGGNGVEAGIMELYDRMKSDRLKIFRTCTDLLEEIRQYHRKDGKVVKKFDDAISALRYAVMMKRFATRLEENKKKYRMIYRSHYTA